MLEPNPDTGPLALAAVQHSVGLTGGIMFKRKDFEAFHPEVEMLFPECTTIDSAWQAAWSMQGLTRQQFDGGLLHCQQLGTVTDLGIPIDGKRWIALTIPKAAGRREKKMYRRLALEGFEAAKNYQKFVRESFEAALK